MGGRAGAGRGVRAEGSSASPRRTPPSPFADSLALHKDAMAAFEALSGFLRRNTATSAAVDGPLGRNRRTSRLGLPLSVAEVEPLSPCLRYAALFPPVPHPLLGGAAADPVGLGDARRVPGANAGAPILIQIRFEGSARWPASLDAMGAARCAMLARLAEGIEGMKGGRGKGDDNAAAFDGPMDVTPTHLDLGYRGYSWRIIVRADREMRMLAALTDPTAGARALRSVRAPVVRQPRRFSRVTRPCDRTAR